MPPACSGRRGRPDAAGAGTRGDGGRPDTGEATGPRDGKAREPAEVDLFDWRGRPAGTRGHRGGLQPRDRRPGRASACSCPEPGDRWIASAARSRPISWTRPSRARSVRRMVQESFAPIYVDGGDAWLDETSPMRPGRYNRSILDAERQADRFTRAGRAGVVLRFGYLYGPGDDPTLMLVDAVRRGWYPLFGRPDGYSSWLAHHDAASSSRRRARRAARDLQRGGRSADAASRVGDGHRAGWSARDRPDSCPRGRQCLAARWAGPLPARSGSRIASSARLLPGSRGTEQPWMGSRR